MTQPWTHSSPNARAYERSDDDWYCEPKWCSERLFEEEEFEGGVYDPCCGTGRIIVAALKAGLKGYGSDLVDRGWDSTRTPHDFLAGRDEHHDNIVCNPPFDLARQFAIRALQLARHKVAMIFPTARLNAARWLEETPLVRAWLLTPRPSMPPGPVLAAGGKPSGGKSDYCWLVWSWANRIEGNEDGHWNTPPEMRWLHRDGDKLL